MRHRKKTIKLGRTSSHRDAMLSNLVCSLIREKRVRTTLPKAKAARTLAEKMVTLGRKGTLAARRQAISTLKQPEAVKELFDGITPKFDGRSGGYTRIYKLGPRVGDAAEQALLEWVDQAVLTSTQAATEAKAESSEEKAPAKPARKPRKKAASASEAGASGA